MATTLDMAIAMRLEGAPWSRVAEKFGYRDQRSLISCASRRARHDPDLHALLADVGRLAPQGRRPIHGHSQRDNLSPTYNSWLAMRSRCHRRGAAGYERYGGRGITVCDRWRNDFAAFLGDMGERPAGMTLDRVDVNGDYEPGNCRWATLAEQQANRRDTAVAFETLARREAGERAVDIAADLGINLATVSKRVRRARELRARGLGPAA